MESLPSSSPPTTGLHRLPSLWPALLLAAGIWLGESFAPSLMVVAACWLLIIFLLIVISQFQSHWQLSWRLCALAVPLLTGMLIILMFGRTLELKRAYVDQSSSPVALAGVTLEPGRLVSGWYGAPDRLEFAFRVRAEKRGAGVDWRKASYRVIAVVENPGGLRVEGGQGLAMAARLEPLTGYANPGGFDWREYHGRRLIAGTARVEDGAHLRLVPRLSSDQRFPDLRRLAAMVQSRLRELHERFYPDPVVRSVADAVLLGERRGLSGSLRGWFTGSGTVHVLVVSGLHLGFIAAALYLLLAALLGRGYASASTACAILLGYALATGARPPVMRAWLLVSFALFALPARRQRSVLNSLSVAFILLLLVNPSWLADAGFQLSFAAVAGIGVGMPVLERFTRGRDWWKVWFWRWLFRLVAVCTVAQLAVAPLVAYHFGRFTPVAFIANPPVVLLAALAVPGGFLADLAALCWFDAGQAVAGVVSHLFSAMIALARWFSSFGWSSLEVPLPGLDDLALCWLALWLAMMFAAGRKRYAGGLLIVLLAWLNLALWRPVAGAFSDSLEVTFLDLGKMTCPVVRLPGGAVLLADPSGGGRLSRWSARQLAGGYLRRHHAGRLDWLLVRGEGVSRWRWVRTILDDFRPGALILTRADQFGGSTAGMLAYCSQRKIALRLATTADTLNEGGAKLFFSGGGGGDGANIPVIEYRGRTMLLSGESGTQRALELMRSFAGKAAVVTELATVPAGARGAPAGNLWIVSAGRVDPGEKTAKVLETGRTGAVRFTLDRDGITVKQSR